MEHLHSNMPCLFPYAIKNKKPFHQNDLWINVPCGKCPDCLKRRSNSWQIRLQEEEKISSSSFFVTATYETSHVPISNNGFMTLHKPDFQKFIKRLRKISIHGRKIKYYACGEYGNKFSRPHYHSILFNANYSDIINAWTLHDNQLGDIMVDLCTPASIAYTLKYMHKAKTIPNHPNDDRIPEFSLMSKGLGLSYLTSEKIAYHLADTDRFYATLQDGIKIALPRYLRDKIYSEDIRKNYAKKLSETSLLESESLFLQSGLSQYDYDKQQFEAKKASIYNFQNKSKR